MIRSYLKNLDSTLSYHPVLGRDFLSVIIEKIILNPLKDKIKITIFTKTEGLLKKDSIILMLDKMSFEKIPSHEKNVA